MFVNKKAKSHICHERIQELVSNKKWAAIEMRAMNGKSGFAFTAVDELLENERYTEVNRVLSYFLRDGLVGKGPIQRIDLGMPKHIMRRLAENPTTHKISGENIIRIKEHFPELAAYFINILLKYGVHF